MRYGYVYETTNLVNGKKYIGRRKGPFDPSYKGSGIALRAALKKYGPEAFSVELLYEASDNADLNVAETAYITERNAVLSETYYNIAVGGNAWGSPKSEETREKIAKAATGRISPLRGRPRPDQRLRMLENNPMKRKDVSEKVRLAQIGKKPTNQITDTFTWQCEQCQKTEERINKAHNRVRFCGKSCAATWHNLHKLNDPDYRARVGRKISEAKRRSK